MPPFQSQVPIYFGSGDRNTSEVKKVFEAQNNTAHFAIMKNSFNDADYVIAAFDCQLKGDKKACEQVKNCSAPLKQCFAKPEMLPRKNVSETCSNDFEDWLGRPVYQFTQLNESVGIQEYDMFVIEDSKRVCRRRGFGKKDCSHQPKFNFSTDGTMNMHKKKYKLWEPCLLSKCQLTLQKLSGKRGIAYQTMKRNKVLGQFRFSKRVRNGVIALMTPTRSLFKLE